MRDLSLHLLDLIENSTRAGASLVAVTIEQDIERDLMTMSIEDNGPGLSAPPERAADPFYTTKPNKRVGLGISLFSAAAERAGGRVEIGSSPLGGVALRAEMKLTHVDRSPLGNIASTLATAICANPGVEFRVTLSRAGISHTISSALVAAQFAGDANAPFLVARQVAAELSNAISRLALSD